ncbi:pleckstrin homology-like domain family B member 1 isoform X1 [Drosophila novamexicana]|uniref:pleckstrin homology-like domain family B member 1 isoform X1 n=2 Tax=Drosophila novamexicana TaxID=47314 RepID=UPI0011E5C73C|nr:pleckstrin homology-like domain family B member 1 isoform X1 [Drosophila novamexicana]
MSLTKKDPSLRVAASDPHLVSLGGGRLSTAVTIHYIHIGDTTIGSAPSCSISLNGSGVRALHCTIYRSEGNEVTLVPEPEARLLIDGAPLEEVEEAKLTQGAMITIGNSNYLRFNNPDEAQMMRSAMGSNERISMPQIDFTQSGRPSDSQTLELESFYESIINPIKSSSNNRDGGHNMDLHGVVQCPKVFSSDLVTVNMPARDVLGQKYASFARNLAENHRGEKQLNNQYAKTLTSSGANGIGHNSGYCNIPSNAAVYKQQQHPQQQQQQHPQQQQQQQLAQPVELLGKVNNDRYDRYPKPGTYTAGSLQIFTMNCINTELNSGAELEDMLKICTEYADRQQQQQQQQQHNNSNNNNNSNHTLHNASAGSITSSPIVQNRIKTNGSLPRDKKSPFQQHAGSSSNLALVSSSSGYENVRLLGPNRVEINGQLHVSTAASTSTLSSSTLSSSAAAGSASHENLPSSTAKYVPQSPRTKIRTNCMSPKKDASFSSAFALASSTPTPPTAVVKPPLAPKPPAPNQQRDYEQLFKSFERKQQLEQLEQQQQQPIGRQLTPAKRSNKNINNLTLNLNESASSQSPKPTRKPAPAPRSINVEQRQRRELQQRRKQLKQELEELPAPTHSHELEPSVQSATTAAASATRPTATATPRQQLLALQNRIHRLEAQRNATRVMEENQQAKLKQSIEMKQDQLNKLRAMLKQKPNNACLKEELEHVCESLDSDRKTFEDLEFQYFEEESEHHACHEELKRQEQRLMLETELASLRIQLGPDEPSVEEPTSPTSGRATPASNGGSSNLVNGVMSQSLFGSAELLCPKRHNQEDLMSRSVNENMFHNNKIELPHGAQVTSTPKRAPLQIYDAGSCEQISFNLSLRSDRFEVNPLERRVPSQDDIDRSCKVANDAPISTSQGASTKIFDSIKEIERNRKLLLAQQGHQVIEHERQKMYDLKKKSHDEARTQYLLSTQQTTEPTIEAPPTQHAPVNANGGKDAKLFEKTELQKLNDETAQQKTQHDKENSASGDGSGSPKTTTTAAAATSQQQRHSQPELEHHGLVAGTTARSPRPLSEANNCEAAIEAPKFANGDAASENKRASSHSNSQDTASAGSGSGSAGSSSGGGGAGGNGSSSSASTSGERKRALPKHQRPLTRYLPIFSPDLNLRHHIETAGHQIDLCPHVFVDAHSCRGYLHKLGATFHAWSRRWFVLDRQRSALIYYSDKSERKPRGGAYFATIDEVYLDHLNASKSGRPHCTFIVKTKKRSYNLQAASDAAARIWIDAIITGAQGNLDY